MEKQTQVSEEREVAGLALGSANRAVGGSSLRRLDKLILRRSMAKESVGGVQEHRTLTTSAKAVEDR